MKAARALPVLMYHHVSPSPGLVTVAPATFAAHMHWLAEHGWTTVGCREAAAFLAGQPLPAKSVLVTFDDGYLDNWVYAHPVLARHGQRAVLSETFKRPAVVFSRRGNVSNNGDLSVRLGAPFHAALGAKRRT